MGRTRKYESDAEKSDILKKVLNCEEKAGISTEENWRLQTKTDKKQE